MTAMSTLLTLLDALDDLPQARNLRQHTYHALGDTVVADATALPVEDGSVTGYRADKVLHVLTDPEQAVFEARRVLAGNGRAVLAGHDWDTLVIDSDDPDLSRLRDSRRMRTSTPHS
jgi:ubiquinone/menaquinone biosynthesis C-methylase UbiE